MKTILNSFFFAVLVLFFFSQAAAQNPWYTDQLSDGDDANGQSLFLGTNNAYPLKFFTFGRERMRIQGTPFAMYSQDWVNVGIGTQNPKSALHLHSEALAWDPASPPNQPERSGGNQVATTPTKSELRISNLESETYGAEGLLLGLQGTRAYLKTYSKTRLDVQNDNAVMSVFPQQILFNDPSSAFGSYGTAQVGIRSANKSGLVITASSNAQEHALGFVGTGTGNAIRIFQGINTDPANVTFVVQQNGRVGIGTGTPESAYMLDVRGKIRSCEVRVNNPGNWCDYVFEPSYSLLPITDLKTYLQTNKHLPEVPTTAEVEANGVELGQMQVTLLKKIEELTLYIVQLNEMQENLLAKNHELEAEINELRATLSSMEKELSKTR